MRKYLGASVIIAATALGSGELILWVMSRGKRFESARRLSFYSGLQEKPWEKVRTGEHTTLLMPSVMPTG